jgi:hypothetical protein
MVGIVVALLGIATLVGLAGEVPGNREERTPATVAALRLGLARDPAPWLGRTVLVRGVAACCFLWATPEHGLPCLAAGPALFDPCPALTSLPLRTSPSRLGGLLASLRGLPMVGHLVPPPQVLRWGMAATYRARLTPLPDVCRSCYAIVLLDVAP